MDVAAVVRNVAAELIPVASPDAPMMEAGLDSLGAVEFRNRLASGLGGAAELPKSVLRMMFRFPDFLGSAVNRVAGRGIVVDMSLP